MTKKILFVLCLFIALVGVISFEQIYTETAIKDMIEKVNVLQTSVVNNEESSKQQVDSVVKFWADKEKIICLFVDYRDIEQIGKQADLVKSHLGNGDFELAIVECNALLHAIENFSNMVKLDFFNIF